MDEQGSISGMGKDVPLHFHIQTGSRVKPASYRKNTSGAFPEGRAAGKLKLVTRYQLAQRLRMRVAVHQLSHTFTSLEVHIVINGTTAYHCTTSYILYFHIDNN